MSTPAIHSGVRSISDVARGDSPTETEWDRAIGIARAELKNRPLKKGERLFFSRSRKYRVQITNPVTVFDPITKQAVTPESVAAQFNRYLYRVSPTSDNGELIIESLTHNQQFGSEFVDAEVAIKKHDEQAAKRLTAQLANAPEEIRMKAAEELLGFSLDKGKKTHEMPQKGGANTPAA